MFVYLLDTMSMLDTMSVFQRVFNAHSVMCESGHCRDKVQLFCIHLWVMIAVTLSHLIKKWIIVREPEEMHCLTNLPNMHSFENSKISTDVKLKK